METMETHVGKLETDLKQWGVKLEELIVKAGKESSTTKIDYRKSLDDLKLKHTAAQTKLRDLKAAGSEKWKNFKSGADAACSEFEVAFKKISAVN